MCITFTLICSVSTEAERQFFVDVLTVVVVVGVMKTGHRLALVDHIKKTTRTELKVKGNTGTKLSLGYLDFTHTQITASVVVQIKQ